MNYIWIAVLMFVVSIVVPVVMYVKIKRKIAKSNADINESIDKASGAVGKVLVSYRKDIDGQMKNFRAGLKQYTRHKVASPQQIQKTRKKMKVVKSLEV